MNKTVFTFLKAVLGQDGAVAMRRAVAKDPRLEYYLVPRTVMGWALGKNEFEGQVPGTEIYVNFQKKEEKYSGAIGIKEAPVQQFEGDQYVLAAYVSEGIGLPTGPFEGTDKMLVTLGKSIDALLKARSWADKLEKGSVDLPGTTHKPTQPEGPQEPEKPVSVQPPIKAKPKLPKLPVLKIEKKDLNKSCKTCSGSQFKDQRFTGCMCWRDLAKHAKTTVYSDGVVVEFTKSADRASVQTLYKELTNGP